MFRLFILFAMAVALMAPAQTAMADDVIIGTTFDSNFGQRDFGDQRGDVKELNLTYRDDGKVWFVKWGVETPQRTSSENEQQDTGRLGIYSGSEWKNISLYLGVDAYNGKVLSFAQDTVRAIHSLSGRGTRTSEASSGFKISPALMARFDTSYNMGLISLHGVAAGKVSIDHNFGGAGVFIRLGKGSEWKPNLWGMPSQDPGSTSLYIGGSIRHVLNEIETHRLGSQGTVGTENDRAAAYAGGVLKITDRISVDASFKKFFTSNVQFPLFIEGSNKPIEEINLNLTLRF